MPAEVWFLTLRKADEDAKPLLETEQVHENEIAVVVDALQDEFGPRYQFQAKKESDLEPKAVLRWNLKCKEIWQIVRKVSLLRHGAPSEPTSVAELRTIWWAADRMLARMRDGAADHSTARRTQTPSDTATPDTDWRDVQRRLMELYKRGDPYTSIGNLAKRLGCAKATIQKAMKPDQPALSGLTEDEKTIAIQNAELLRKWQTQRSKGKATLRATSLTKVVMNNTAQPREADPSDVLADDDVEKAMRHLIEEAKPEERAKLNDLDAEQRRAMAETYYAHKLDEEPSPLEDDPPDKRPRKVVQHKRV